MERKKRSNCLKNFLRILYKYIRHYPFVLYWCFYDLFLTAWTRLRRIEYIGVYVKIMSPSEFALLFEESDVGCGYNGFTLVKLYFKKQWATVKSIIDLLDHEVLHSVLRKRIGAKASSELDNIQKNVGLRIYWWDAKKQLLVKVPSVD